MAVNIQLAYGSNGSNVKNLQKLLNRNGYNLNEDGIFGSNTQAAVRDYQKKNKLAVDGIVGTNTWGALNKASSGANKSTGSAVSTAASKTSTNMIQSQGYKQSDAVSQAQAMLNQKLAQKPGAYQSPWQAQLDEAMKKILNREKFSYDLNGDALYQQYKDQYILQGQQAMMDTMGQAAALTGGYGNSYAQTAGQQAYNAHLQQLNDIVPELYQMALNRYQMEGDEMYNQAALLAQQEEQGYGRYRDQVSDYNAELGRLQDQYYTERDYDYGKYVDNRDYQYQQDRDKTADNQWDLSFQYQKDRDTVADSQWQKEFDEAIRQWNHKNGISTGDSSKPSGGGSNGDGPGSGPGDGPGTGPGNGQYDNGGLSDAGIRILQKALGVKADGKWGAESQAAAKAKWGVTSAADAYKKYTGGRDDDGDGWVDTEDKMADYVKRMLDNATSSQFNPKQVINANNKLTPDDKKIALEILDKYIKSGYMKF